MTKALVSNVIKEFRWHFKNDVTYLM